MHCWIIEVGTGRIITAWIVAAGVICSIGCVNANWSIYVEVINLAYIDSIESAVACCSIRIVKIAVLGDVGLGQKPRENSRIKESSKITK